MESMVTCRLAITPKRWNVHSATVSPDILPMDYAPGTGLNVPEGGTNNVLNSEGPTITLPLTEELLEPNSPPSLILDRRVEHHHPDCQLMHF